MSKLGKCMICDLFCLPQDLCNHMDFNLHKVSLNLEDGVPLLMLHDSEKKDKYYYAMGEYIL
jgi:hypothetical protein